MFYSFCFKIDMNMLLYFVVAICVNDMLVLFLMLVWLLALLSRRQFLAVHSPHNCIQNLENPINMIFCFKPEPIPIFGECLRLWV